MGAQAMELTQADLDGDGKPEWLVSQFQSQSNGLGVKQHRLCVLWPHQPGRTPLCREVSEWQSLTVWVHESGRAGCALMDSKWQGGQEAGLGKGTYAVGQLHRVEGQRWQAVKDRPTVKRRLRDDFMAEREALPQSNAQRLWYQRPGARPGP